MADKTTRVVSGRAEETATADRQPMAMNISIGYLQRFYRDINAIQGQVLSLTGQSHCQNQNHRLELVPEPEPLPAPTHSPSPIPTSTSLYRYKY